MGNTEKDTGKKKLPPPRYGHILAPGFAAAPEAHLTVEVHSAPFPQGLLPRLQRAWKSNPDARSPFLPTYALRELVECVEPGVVAVDSRLEEGPWLHALQQPHNDLPLQLALETWITTQVAPHQDDVDWFTLIKAATPLEWSSQKVDLLRRGRRPNGTVSPHRYAYDLLASYLAGRWVDQKLTLPGQKAKESAVLGPVSGRGERAVFLWPPRELTDEDAYGLWTHQTTFRVVTMPHDDRLLLRVIPHISRFGGTPPAYIPRRSSDKPATATVLLHIPGGVLRDVERPLLLRAPVTVTGRMGEMTWRWQPGISRILPSLPTSHLYPDPNMVRTAPRTYSGLHRAEVHQSDPVALLWHAAGYTYLPEEPGDGVALTSHHSGKDSSADDVRDTYAEARRPRAHGHPADTGLQPIDHLLLFEQLSEPMAAWGFKPLDRLEKISQRRAPRLGPASPDAVYHLELWHAAPGTQDAVHLALTRVLGYTRTSVRTDGTDHVHCYRGECEIHLRLRNPGTLTSGLPHPTVRKSDERSAFRRRQRDERTTALKEAFPAAEQLTGCLIEIGKPVSFAAAHQDDPKPLLKKVLPSLNRHVQCMHPVSRTAQEDAKQEGAKPFEGTKVRCDDIERAVASVKDILRSLGHLPCLPAPRGIDGPFELSTVHIARSRGGIVPMLLRMHPDGHTTAQLIATLGHPREDPMPLSELPRALTAGRGRIRQRDRAQLADFLTQALALDSSMNRLFLARTQTLRNKEVWPWLQNDHITPDALLLPGTDCASPIRSAPRTPTDLPGLRIVRLNDDAGEIPLAFGVNVTETAAQSEEAAPSSWSEEGQGAVLPEGAEEGCPTANGDDTTATNPLPYEWGRYSGVVPWNEHTYLAINPRPDTHQLPKGVSKYNGAERNATRHGANPTSLEIHMSFLQPTDKAADLASYVNNLRRCHLHTTTPTRLPLLLHIARLMEEYID
ncbi:hypothetical protein Sgleb_60210 [Streptomyces glebosus]|uniref:DUF3893 domain-containing protein n=1 Tax=Streptomyces glebosus TaxID=249580 RepID=A0A640T459_9ACTN|nr:RNaseH domain-containing protein [Streptomyces glebosus]GFE17974.1 hypothetical protein Sgleb_60210 [Streptomyces glebosus]GHG46799.1 hypothetical protein GCM10010513_02790 [Streptomyces glebosus]